MGYHTKGQKYLDPKGRVAGKAWASYTCIGHTKCMHSNDSDCKGCPGYTIWAELDNVDCSSWSDYELTEMNFVNIDTATSNTDGLDTGKEPKHISKHGTCFNNGQGGNCNINCNAFKAANCSAYADVLDAEFGDMTEKEKSEVTADYELKELYPDYFHIETIEEKVSKFRDKIRKEVKKNEH